MRYLIALAFCAAVVTVLPPASNTAQPETERGFQVAQRFCPNGRC
jgi:hypothetical protein